MPRVLKRTKFRVHPALTLLMSSLSNGIFLLLGRRYPDVDERLRMLMATVRLTPQMSLPFNDSTSAFPPGSRMLESTSLPRHIAATLVGSPLYPTSTP